MYESPVTIYRLGYYNRLSQTIIPIPLGHGGFFDFRIVSGPGYDIERLLKSKERAEKNVHLQRLAQFRKALRPYNSDAWALGSFSFPRHIVTKPSPVPFEWLDRLYLLEGHTKYVDGKINVEWINHGQLPDSSNN